jgi:hypothetical protein
MKLTWPKNKTSNWSRTRFWVASEGESSSTVPTTAIITHQLEGENPSDVGVDIPSEVEQNKISIRPKTSFASATAAPHCAMTLPSQRMPLILSFQPSRSLRSRFHSLINSLNSRLRS